ncbi:MAG: alpha/beta fold hydrolase, partial [Acidimicrobiia bacterium]|nr:alpha/beta fold hydrolase [Acidimicrobiia bacterium]
MTIDVPSLLPGRFITIAGRGEFFVRYAPHADATAPVVLLLHGWTASSDLNFFTAYHELSQFATVVGIDHRGHGRGLRPDEPFSLEDCADDAAAVARELGAQRVVAVGYSMGGPIAMLLARRHPDLVAGLVLQATAMEWRATRRERTRWQVSRALGPITRRFVRPRLVRLVFARRFPRRHALRSHLGWMLAEWRRESEAGGVEAHNAMALVRVGKLVPQAYQIGAKRVHDKMPKDVAYFQKGSFIEQTDGPEDEPVSTLARLLAYRATRAKPMRPSFSRRSPLVRSVRAIVKLQKNPTPTAHASSAIEIASCMHRRFDGWQERRKYSSFRKTTSEPASHTRLKLRRWPSQSLVLSGSTLHSLRPSPSDTTVATAQAATPAKMHSRRMSKV